MYHKVNDKFTSLKKEADDVLDSLNRYEVDADLYEEQFNNQLNDTCGEITICGCTFEASRIFKELDNSYESALQEFVDNTIAKTETEGYQDLITELTEVIDEMEELVEQTNNSDDALILRLCLNMTESIEKYQDKMEDLS